MKHLITLSLLLCTITAAGMDKNTEKEARALNNLISAINYKGPYSASSTQHWERAIAEFQKHIGRLSTPNDHGYDMLTKAREANRNKEIVELLTVAIEKEKKEADEARKNLIKWIRTAYPYSVVDFTWDGVIAKFQEHGSNLSEPIENGRTALELAEQAKNWCIVPHLQKALKKEILDPKCDDLILFIAGRPKTFYKRGIRYEPYQHGCIGTFMAFALHDLKENGCRLVPPADPYDSDQEEYGTRLLATAHRSKNRPAIKMLKDAIREELEEAGKKEAAASEDEMEACTINTHEE